MAVIRSSCIPEMSHGNISFPQLIQMALSPCFFGGLTHSPTTLVKKSDSQAISVAGNHPRRDLDMLCRMIISDMQDLRGVRQHHTLLHPSENLRYNPVIQIRF